MIPPNGWKGVIEHGGGTQAIHPEEGIVFENAGIYIHHNDKYDTTTFLPIFTVRMVRWHDAAKEKEGPNVSATEVGRRTQAYHDKVQQLKNERKELTDGTE